MADVGDAAAGGCCLVIAGVLQQYFDTSFCGGNWTCCDKCCRCECCWDNGEFDPNDRPGAAMQQQQETGTKANGSVQRSTEPGEEDLPSYKASEQMTVLARLPGISQATSSPAGDVAAT
ncbi:hypothetical protein CBS101457_005929 [Exobasidium rhododendri]|nr:hypothetical protein CBS101457_005929 [Exobasidium rhododendri]